MDESPYPYGDTFHLAKEVLYNISDCRGLKIEGIEQDEDSVAEIDSVDAVLDYLNGLEWEYNIEYTLPDYPDVQSYLHLTWTDLETVKTEFEEVSQRWGRSVGAVSRIVRRVKAGKVEGYDG